MSIARTQPQDLPTQRKILLDLINMERRDAGQSEVDLDDKLSELAQEYAMDQVKRNYSGHYNP